MCVEGRGRCSFRSSYIIAMLSLLYHSGLVFLPSLAWQLYLLPPPFVPCPRILKSCLCFPAQPLAGSNFIYQSKPIGGRVPHYLMCRFPCNFGHPINTIQELDQIHNTTQLQTCDPQQLAHGWDIYKNAISGICMLVELTFTRQRATMPRTGTSFPELARS